MADRDIVWDEITLLQDTWIRIWQSYMRWFSWHFLTHLGSLAAVMSNEALRKLAATAALFMGFFGLLGAGAAVALWMYDHSVRVRLEELRNDPKANDALFGGAILKMARWACLATKLLIIAAWGYVYCKA
jgi:hypothetical protein